MLQNGVSHKCACVELSAKGRYRTNFGRCANLPKKGSCDLGYRSDTIAISRDTGPLSSLHTVIKKIKLIKKTSAMRRSVQSAFEGLCEETNPRKERPKPHDA